MAEEETPEPDQPTNDQSQIQEQIDKEVAGLKATNQSLKEEKKKFQERAKLLDQLGGDDGIKALLEMKTRIDTDEETKLFVSGDREEYNNRITNRVREDAEARLSALQKQLEDSETSRDTWQERYNTQQVSLSISEASERSGVNPRLKKAIEGQIRDSLYFDVDENKVFVQESGNVKYGKDGHPMEVSELIELLRDEQPELFLSSTGSGATGGTPGGLTARLSRDKVSSMSMADYAKARKEGRIT